MSTAELTSAERKEYRGIAMNLKPAITVGKSGITEPLLAETLLAFSKSPVLKIRFTAADRTTRANLTNELAERCGATLCGSSGHTAVLHRPLPPPPTQATS
jgi:RNA-binding protein YhbY